MFRISLRSMLLLVALVAIGIVSLAYASAGWRTAVGGITMVALFAALVTAAADRGERQAFALGMALVMTCYGVTVLSAGGTSVRNSEFSLWDGWLPTTIALRYVHMAVDRSVWVDPRGGQEIVNFDPYKAGAVDSRGRPNSLYQAGFKRELPPPAVFMPIGHMWWALLLGLLGGWCASALYRRRTGDQEPLAAGRS